jgi:hypothetical protein
MLTRTSGRRLTAALAAPLLFVATLSAEPLPSRLQGSWRIVRVLPTGNTPCWAPEQAQPLVGSTLSYSQNALRWKGGSVPLLDINTRTVTADEFMKENGGGAGAARFTQLGIRSSSVLEVDFQHEDMDITGSTTEVPGDSVLLAGPNRIVVSACGVFFEATRSAGISHTNLAR